MASDKKRVFTYKDSMDVNGAILGVAYNGSSIIASMPSEFSSGNAAIMVFDEFGSTSPQQYAVTYNNADYQVQASTYDKSTSNLLGYVNDGNLGSGGGEVLLFNGVSGSITSFYDVANDTNSDMEVYNDTIYLATGGDANTNSTVHKYDNTTYTLINSFEVEQDTQDNGLWGITHDGESLLTTNVNTGKIYIHNNESPVVIDSYTISVEGLEVTASSICMMGDDLLIADIANYKIHRFSWWQGTSESTIKITSDQETVLACTQLGITENLEIEDAALSWTLHQFRTSETLRGIISVLAKELQTIESDSIIPLLYERTLDSAEGKVLDDLGVILNIKRDALNDNQYKLLLKLAGLRRSNRATLDDVLAIIYFLTGDTKTKIKQTGYYGVEAYFDFCVYRGVYTSIPTQPFGFSGNPDAFPFSSTSGDTGGLLGAVLYEDYDIKLKILDELSSIFPVVTQITMYDHSTNVGCFGFSTNPDASPFSSEGGLTGGDLASVMFAKNV